jgi:hypothetical protein
MATARLRLNLVFISWHRRTAPTELVRWSLTFTVRLAFISGLALGINGDNLLTIQDQPLITVNTVLITVFSDDSLITVL